MRTFKILMASAFVGAIFAAAPANAQMTDATSMWTGPYVGANVGYVFNGDTRVDRTTGDLSNNQNALSNNLRPTERTVSDKGFTVGGQVGYNAVVGSGILVGAEADLAYTDLSKTDTQSNTSNFAGGVIPSPTPITRVNQYRGELNYLGTVRGRVGYAFGNALVYGTGGLAYGRVKQSATFFGPNMPTTPFFTGENKRTAVGYAAGGGVEFALPTTSFANVFGSSAVTMRAEYLHYDLGRDSLRLDGVNGGSTIGGYDARVRTSGDLIRAGLNYKF